MTPLEAKVFENFKHRLAQEGVGDAIVVALSEAFVAERLPSADALVATIKERSGGRSA